MALQGFTLWRRHLFLVSQSGARKKIFFLGCSTFSSVATRILIMNGMKSDPAGSCRALECRTKDGWNEAKRTQESSRVWSFDRRWRCCKNECTHRRSSINTTASHFQLCERRKGGGAERGGDENHEVRHKHLLTELEPCEF